MKTHTLNTDCEACGIHCYQKPLLEPLRASQVVCVGLSAKPYKFDNELPLDTRTNSGHVISQLEALCGISFYKTNLVKCAPLESDKLRYPTKDEIVHCIPHLQKEIIEIHPKVVLMLGKQVTSGISMAQGFCEPQTYDSIKHNGITYLSIPHPSYLWVYKRKELIPTLTKIAQLITQAITDAG